MDDGVEWSDVFKNAPPFKKNVTLQNIKFGAPPLPPRRSPPSEPTPPSPPKAKLWSPPKHVASSRRNDVFIKDGPARLWTPDFFIEGEKIAIESEEKSIDTPAISGSEEHTCDGNKGTKNEKPACAEAAVPNSKPPEPTLYDRKTSLAASFTTSAEATKALKIPVTMPPSTWQSLAEVFERAANAQLDDDDAFASTFNVPSPTHTTGETSIAQSPISTSASAPSVLSEVGGGIAELSIVPPDDDDDATFERLPSNDHSAGASPVQSSANPHEQKSGVVPRDIDSLSQTSTLNPDPFDADLNDVHASAQITTKQAKKRRNRKNNKKNKKNRAQDSTHPTTAPNDQSPIAHPAVSPPETEPFHTFVLNTIANLLDALEHHQVVKAMDFSQFKCFLAATGSAMLNLAESATPYTLQEIVQAYGDLQTALAESGEMPPSYDGERQDGGKGEENYDGLGHAGEAFGVENIPGANPSSDDKCKMTGVLSTGEVANLDDDDQSGRSGDQHGGDGSDDEVSY